MSTPEQIWSVSDVNRAVREVVEGALMPFWMAGEVGSLTLHRSGHAYFTMKDAKSQIRAVYFGGGAECTRLGVVNGSLIEAFGNLSVYEVRGEYQFGIKSLRLAGIGYLQKRFEELKRKLAAEGLFDQSRKKTIPVLPRRIGVVTSPSGAAIRDFLQIINRRFPNVHVRIYPCAVQGAGAAEQVTRGVEFFNRSNSVDVIVVTRGGGSMEDLWPFNEEKLARAVANSRIPVVSAVGHEIDFSICDFAADLRVPTPSAAAELVIGRRAEMEKELERNIKDMRYILDSRLMNLKRRLERAAGSFVFREPIHLVKMRRQQLDELDNRLSGAAERFLTQQRSRLERREATLGALDPRRQLERGYAILLANQKPVTSIHNAPPGTHLTAQLADGDLNLLVQ